MDTQTVPSRLRVERVREALLNAGMQALLVPSADPHLSEYLPERWQSRQWVSGFTGSMGTLVVTLEKAVLFADSRYWVQAEVELADSGIELIKIGPGHADTLLTWLVAEVASGGIVSADGQVLGLAMAASLRTGLAAASIALHTDRDLMETVWTERPGLPLTPVYEHCAPYAPVTRAVKLSHLRAAMAQAGATHHFVSTVDDIAWVTNLRGSDVSYNPVFLAHFLLDEKGATLFILVGKVDAELRARLAADDVFLADYTKVGDALQQLSREAVLLLDPKRVTVGLRAHVPAHVRVLEALNPSTRIKSCKTVAEIAHVRATMIEDGAAMCEFYAWFESAAGRERITELTIDERLSAARAKRANFVGLSFPTIAAFNANGAMPHYRALPHAHAVIEGNGLLLIDSGGQYLGGTTDITRVWPIGEVTSAMKRDYTLVLKGMLALSRARFPRGTLSPMLDALARAPLWEHGLEFGHGTGHGVGYFLNVHEGPQSISKAVPEPQMAMEPGMITSIEPGVYRPGQWGIRIENLVANVAVDTPEGDAFAEMLGFETLTLCPIDTRCLDHTLLRADEIAWLNAYHEQVQQRLAPHVSPAGLSWLVARTVPIQLSADF